MGHEIVFPGAGYIAMAMEAIHQTSHAIAMNQESKIMDKSCYRLRDVVFPKALVLEEDGKEYKIMLTLTPRSGIKDSWYEFKVSSLTEGVWSEHSRGLVRLEPIDERGMSTNVSSLVLDSYFHVIIRRTRACHVSTYPYNTRATVVQGNARCWLQFWAALPKAIRSGVGFGHTTESISCFLD